jgi:predicted nucleotidyltransferase
LRNFDIVLTRDNIWFHVTGSPAGSSGYYGSPKYVGCDPTEATTCIAGIPASRIWSKSADGLSRETGDRLRTYSQLSDVDARYFIPEERVVRCYHSADAAQSILMGRCSLPRAAIAREFLRVLIQFGAEEGALGVIGSYLLEKVTADSDLDVVVEGLPSITAVWNGLQTSAPEAVRFRNRLDWEAYELFGETVGLSPSDYASHNVRKVDRGYFRGLEFSIIGISAASIRPDGPVTRLGEVRVTGEVMSHTAGGFLPGRWRVSLAPPLAGRAGAWLVNSDREFTFQVFEGERFHAQCEALLAENDLYLVVDRRQRPKAFICADPPLRRRLM